MKDEAKGWVVVNIGHPTSGVAYVVTSTFAYRRKDAIANFVSGSGETWKYWRKNYNFRAKRATCIVETIETKTE